MSQFPPRRHERVAPETLTLTPRVRSSLPLTHFSNDREQVGRAPGLVTPERPVTTTIKAHAAKETAAVRTAFARSGERAVQATRTLEGNSSERQVQSVILEVDRQRDELVQEVNKAVSDLFSKIRERRGPSRVARETSRSGEITTKRPRTSEMLGSQSPINSMISRSSLISDLRVEPAPIHIPAPNSHRGGNASVEFSFPSPPETPPRHRMVRPTESNRNSGVSTMRGRLGLIGNNERGAETDVSEESGSDGPGASESSESEESEDDVGYWVKPKPAGNRREVLLSSTYDDLDLSRER
ncbi:hypothetical protein BDZ94DRAFT_1267654 [Collybia nuda]|uniref:Uncharacterized protein n=1 Tax=Collybia nuda TaxID=64659 RepID=A0A9P6CBP3_9AGAR|nr:hypothetical protein BDZ94DRAFT_1267654 [Collybia nuda]